MSEPHSKDKFQRDFKRTGPHPLASHIALATQALQGMATPVEAQRGAADMLSGIKKYQAYDAPRYARVYDIVRCVGGSRLLRFCADVSDSAVPVFLVPSLINKYNVFDLHQDHSFVQFLSEQGYDVYVLDWGDLGQDDADLTLDEIVAERLCDFASYIHKKRSMLAHAIGYCMGGTLLMGAACLQPSLFRSLSLIATPWDFSAVGMVMYNQVRLWAPATLTYLTTQNILPSSHVQSLFAALYPEQTAEKFSRFARMDGGRDEAVFVAVEDWLNDGVDLPYHIARACIQSWFLDNDPGQGAWHLCGTLIDPSVLGLPVHIVASDRDKLVEAPSSLGLADILHSSNVLNPFCGHVGMMAGRDCVDDVWTPISAWIAAQNGL